MGVVWAVTNTVTGRRVAMKLLHEDAAKDPGTRRRFLREGRAASAVQHPNVVEILDFIELEDQTPAMVMELLDGESLGQRLRREHKLSIGEVARVIVPAIGAVGTAHAHGVVHRDLKPDNIFLAHGHEGGTVVVKVLDFGIAKMSAEPDGAASNALTGTGAMLGTPYYMAPEQLFTDETLDYRCDIWALGIILYECLAGMRPTRANSFADIVKVIATQSMVPFANAAPDVPAEIATLVTRMLSFDKSKRPQTLREVSDVLEHYTDVLATSFGAPVLRPMKQSLDDSGDARGLRKADVALLFGNTDPRVHSAPTANHQLSAADGPATVTVKPVERSAPPPKALKRDSQSETLATSAERGADAAAQTAPGKRSRFVALAAAGLAFAVAFGYVVTAEKKGVSADASASTGSVASPSPRPGPTPTPGPIPSAVAEPTPLSATDAATAPAPSASASAVAMKAAVAAVRPKPNATGAAVTTTPAEPPAPRPTASTTGSPGGLVEKPPF
ncbi:MAG: Serine/threonine protein kinase [Labilithrix sp.]|nr:Serine/threonine protein kinase [Labilithrix sp.]